MHPRTQWLPKSLWLFWDPKQSQPHDRAPQHPLAPPGRPVAGGCCTCNPSLSLTPQGTQYWRFDDGALDPGYPRDISEGFEGIPDNVDAAFALPAHSYHGNERVYFFKGKRSSPPCSWQSLAPLGTGWTPLQCLSPANTLLILS